MLASLCNSSIRLRCTFPILNNIMDSSDNVKRQLTPSDNASPLMMNSIETNQYSTFGAQIDSKYETNNSGIDRFNWSFSQVLEKLLDLILIPIKRNICREKSNSLPELILNCCYVLSRVIAELAAQSSEDELQAACGRLLYNTPCRFARTNQTRSWNTGNGSPDAICFSVDKPGIVIAGAGIYTGAGVYEYELELLDDVSQ